MECTCSAAHDALKRNTMIVGTNPSQVFIKQDVVDPLEASRLVYRTIDENKASIDLLSTSTTDSVIENPVEDPHTPDTLTPVFLLGGVDPLETTSTPTLRSFDSHTSAQPGSSETSFSCIDEEQQAAANSSGCFLLLSPSQQAYRSLPTSVSFSYSASLRARTPPPRRSATIDAGVLRKRIRGTVPGALKAGLQLVGLLTEASYQMVSDVNRATTNYVDEQIDVTACAISFRADRWARDMRVDERWRRTLRGHITRGSMALQDAVHSISDGVHQALSFLSICARRSVGYSIEAVRRVDAGLSATCEGMKKPWRWTLEFWNPFTAYGDDATSTSVSPAQHIAVGGSFPDVSLVEDTQHLSVIQSIIETAQDVMDFFEPLSSVSPLEVGRALAAISMLQHATLYPYPPVKQMQYIDTTVEKNVDLLEELEVQLRRSLAVYSPTLLRLWNLKTFASFVEDTSSCVEAVHEALGLPPDAVVVNRDFSELYKPAYLMAVDHQRCEILVLVRGSTEFSDLLTDLRCDGTDTHAGMRLSAEWILKEIRATLVELAEVHLTYRVILAGHSLGGATATLMTLTLLNEGCIAKERLRAYSFGAPCVMRPELGRTLREHVISVSFGMDIIGRLSLGSAENLRMTILELVMQTGKINNTVHVGGPRELSSVLTRGIDSDVAIVNKENVMINEALDPVIPHSNAEELFSYHKAPKQGSGYPAAMNRLLSMCKAPLTLMDPALSVSKIQSEQRREEVEAPLMFTTSSLLSGVRQLEKAKTSGNSTAIWDARQKLQEVWKTLMLKQKDENVLLPAGRYLMVIPAEDLQEAVTRFDKCHLTLGDCVIAEVLYDGFEDIATLSQLILNKASFTHHLPQHLAVGLVGQERMKLPYNRKKKD